VSLHLAVTPRQQNISVGDLCVPQGCFVAKFLLYMIVHISCIVVWRNISLRITNYSNFPCGIKHTIIVGGGTNKGWYLKCNLNSFNAVYSSFCCVLLSFLLYVLFVPKTYESQMLHAWFRRMVSEKICTQNTVHWYFLFPSVCFASDYASQFLSRVLSLSSLMFKLWLSFIIFRGS